MLAAQKMDAIPETGQLGSLDRRVYHLEMSSVFSKSVGSKRQHPSPARLLVRDEPEEEEDEDNEKNDADEDEDEDNDQDGYSE